MDCAIVMPKVGLTMTEGKIVEWKKAVGDRVEKGEIIFVFETEKVSFDVDSLQSGYLTKIIVPEGETVPVGAEVATLAKSRDVPSASGQTTKSAAPVTDTPPAPASGGATIERRTDKIRATPLARRIARSNGLDLAQVAASASEPLKKKDIEAFIARSDSAGETKSRVTPPLAGDAGGHLVKRSSMRDIIARKMLASTAEAAQAYMVVSVDAGHLVEARERLTPSLQKQTGVKPTLTDLLAKIVAVAIARHPIVNTRWSADGIIWLDKIHLGIATALEDGLVVPVISDIGSKKLSDISKERAALIDAARTGKLLPEQMSGSTFTISSLGMFGVEEFSAIINQPESAILAIGAIIDTPVARDGAVVIRPIMKMTLTYDHRIIDGAKAAAFVGTLKEVIEEPLLALA